MIKILPSFNFPFASAIENMANGVMRDYVVERTSKTTASITISNVANGKIEYKFTRGSWNAREQDATGADTIGPEKKQNRSYLFDEDNAVEEVEIEKWSDIKSDQ